MTADTGIAPTPCAEIRANSAWTVLAAITHNLLRAVGTPRGEGPRGGPQRHPAPASGRRPGRIAVPQGKRTLHLPAHWPQVTPWKALSNNTFTIETRQVAA